MVRDLGLSWRGYEGGGVESNGDPHLSAVTHTGRHHIPILYEREVTAIAPAPAAV